MCKLTLCSGDTFYDADNDLTYVVARCVIPDYYNCYMYFNEEDEVEEPLRVVVRYDELLELRYLGKDCTIYDL